MMIGAVVPNPAALVEICDFAFSCKLDVNDDIRDTARESLDYRKSFATSRMIAMRYARRELRRSNKDTNFRANRRELTNVLCAGYVTQIVRR